MRFVPVVLLLASACKPADPASDVVPVGSTYSLLTAPPALFELFEGDVADLTVAILDLEFAAADIDLTVEPKDRAFTLEPLTAEHLGGATAPPGTDPNNQISTIMLGMSTAGFDANYDLVLEPNYVCIESGTTVSYRRTFTSDTACWADRSCEFLRSTNEVRKENLIAKAWYDLFKDYRRVDLADGRTALVARSWSDKVYPSDSGNHSFNQNFTAEIWLPQGETTFHAYAMWAEIDLGLPDAFMQGEIIDGLGEGMEFADEFMSGVAPEDYCPNDRDEVYERPPA